MSDVILYTILVARQIDSRMHFERYYVAADSEESAYRLFSDAAGRVMTDRVFVLRDDVAQAARLSPNVRPAVAAPEPMELGAFELWARDRGGIVYREF